MVPIGWPGDSSGGGMQGTAQHQPEEEGPSFASTLAVRVHAPGGGMQAAQEVQHTPRARPALALEARRLG